MKIYNYDDENKYPQNDESYGGLTGKKLGIYINKEHWLLKFSGSIRDFDKVEMSYSTASVSEYIGSHIYEIIGIDAHQTLLGEKDNKIVVACKDFRDINKHENRENFGEIKNIYIKDIDGKLEEISSSKNIGESLEEIKLIMDNNPIFKKLSGLKERFWDMFVVDSLIGNNDRNFTNWGTLKNPESGERRIMPVYDCGSAFSNKSSNQQIQNILNDSSKFISSVYHSATCIFTENNKKINPLKYIESQKEGDLNNAILRIVPKINMAKIKEMINEIPEEYDGLEVMSSIRKEFYIKTLEYRYENVLLPTYKKLLEEQRKK